MTVINNCSAYTRTLDGSTGLGVCLDGSSAPLSKEPRRLESELTPESESYEYRFPMELLRALTGGAMALTDERLLWDVLG